MTISRKTLLKAMVPAGLAVLTPAAANAAGYGYNYTYPLVYDWTVSAPSGDSLWRYIYPRLSYFFPLSGMVNSPRVGQQLNIAGKNPVKIVEVGSRHLKLVSLPGHVEGAGNYLTLTIGPNSEWVNANAYGPKASSFPYNCVPGPTWALFTQKIQNDVCMGCNVSPWSPSQK